MICPFCQKFEIILGSGYCSNCTVTDDYNVYIDTNGIGVGLKGLGFPYVYYDNNIGKTYLYEAIDESKLLSDYYLQTNSLADIIQTLKMIAIFQ